MLLHDHANDPNFKFLMTRHLCLDHIEKFFCTVQCCGGWNDRPSCSQFINILRKLYYNNILQESNSSNCEDDNVVKLLDWFCFDELDDNELSSSVVEEDSLLN